MRDDLPTGTVTFLFTDVEGSTKLLRSVGADARGARRAPSRCARGMYGGGRCRGRHPGGRLLLRVLVGPGALAAAQRITDSLSAGPIHLRIGLHTGTPVVTGEGYVGDDVHLALRVAASAHGGQVVLSTATRELVDGISLTDLGEHRLKDIDGGVSIFQLGDGSFPPLKTISNTNLPRPASSFEAARRCS